MITPGILDTTAALMTLVAAACTVLCLAWSVPAWRRRLAPGVGGPNARVPRAGRLSGWTARAGGGLVATGIAGCALVAWYCVYCTVAAI
jgi:hypothetical protein